jgi:hypothetical protein
MLRVTRIGIRFVGIFPIFVLLGGMGNAHAQEQFCIQGQYKYSDAKCPEGCTDQGECTTRTDGLPNPKFWCCCPTGFPPSGGCGGSTINTGGSKPTTSPWAASVAIQQTSNPTLTDEVLRLVRDNVLQRNQRGKRYVDLVYKFSGDVDQILSTNSKLVTDTTTFLNENLPLFIKLANVQKVTVSNKKIEQVLALLKRYSDAASGNLELRRAIANAQSDLKNKQFLAQLGVRVVN